MYSQSNRDANEAQTSSSLIPRSSVDKDTSMQDEDREKREG
jgi:hypothetical protein